MFLTLMYITNNPDVALIAEKYGVCIVYKWWYFSDFNIDRLVYLFLFRVKYANMYLLYCAFLWL